MKSEMLAKLPKWAQAEVMLLQSKLKSAEHERDVAINAVNGGSESPMCHLTETSALKNG
jgi:hypothetical protein